VRWPLFGVDRSFVEGNGKYPGQPLVVCWLGCNLVRRSKISFNKILKQYLKTFDSDI